METVVFHYSLAEALADGVLHLVGMRGSQPIVVTAGVLDELPQDEIRQIVKSFVAWQQCVEPGLAEEERMFKVKASNDELVWVIDDGSALTVMYPREY